MLKNHLQIAVYSILSAMFVTKILTLVFIRFNKTEFRYVNERLISMTDENLRQAVSYYKSSSYLRFSCYKFICFCLIAASWYYVTSFGVVYNNSHSIVIGGFIMSVILYWIIFFLLQVVNFMFYKLAKNNSTCCAYGYYFFNML